MVSRTGTCLVSVGFFILVSSSRHGHTWLGQKKQFASVCLCKKREDKSSDDSGHLNHFLINYLSGCFRGKCFPGIWIIHIFVKCDNAFIFNATVHNTGRHREYKLVIKTSSLVIRKFTQHIINGLAIGSHLNAFHFMVIALFYQIWKILLVTDPNVCGCCWRERK